jgi:hypothetical protein
MPSRTFGWSEALCMPNTVPRKMRHDYYIYLCRPSSRNLREEVIGRLTAAFKDLRRDSWIPLQERFGSGPNLRVVLNPNETHCGAICTIRVYIVTSMSAREWTRQARVLNARRTIACTRSPTTF